MKNNFSGFTLIELLIAIAIVGILATIALPSYQKYTRKAHYSEVIQAAAPYKLGVEECFLITGDTKDCQSGENGVPKNFTGGKDLVNKVTVDKGIITVTPNNLYGIKASDNYVLEPKKNNDQLTWKKSGGGIDAGYANK